MEPLIARLEVFVLLDEHSLTRLKGFVEPTHVIICGLVKVVPQCLQEFGLEFRLEDRMRQMGAVLYVQSRSGVRVFGLDATATAAGGRAGGGRAGGGGSGRLGARLPRRARPGLLLLGEALGHLG